MTVSGREAQALAKLMRLARAKTEECAARVGTLRGAIAANEAAMKLLSDKVRDESGATRAAETVGFAQLAGYLQGAEQKRVALAETHAQLTAEAAGAESDLNAAWVELKKLEHLSERMRSAFDRRRGRREGAEDEDLARLGAAVRLRR